MISALICVIYILKISTAESPGVHSTVPPLCPLLITLETLFPFESLIQKDGQYTFPLDEQQYLLAY